MNIKFKLKNGKEYTLANDLNGYQVGTELLTKNKEGREIRNIQGARYYATLESALQGIFELGVRKSDATTFNELARDIADMKNMVLGWRDVIHEVLNN